MAAATPNRGTKLADYADKILNISTRVFKTMQSLRTHDAQTSQGQETAIHIGAIAGNRSNL
jgi:hypothetical protein